MEYIFSKDGQICSVILFLPNKQKVSRTINQLSPLKIPPITDDDDTDDIQQAAVEIDAQDDSQEESRSGRRSKRAAAIKAHQRLAEYFSDEVANVVFRCPHKCHGVPWMILQYCNNYQLT